MVLEGVGSDIDDLFRQFPTRHQPRNANCRGPRSPPRDAEQRAKGVLLLEKWGAVLDQTAVDALMAVGPRTSSEVLEELDAKADTIQNPSVFVRRACDYRKMSDSIVGDLQARSSRFWSQEVRVHMVHTASVGGVGQLADAHLPSFGQGQAPALDDSGSLSSSSGTTMLDHARVALTQPRADASTQASESLASHVRARSVSRGATSAEAPEHLASHVRARTEEPLQWRLTAAEARASSEDAQARASSDRLSMSGAPMPESSKQRARTPSLSSLSRQESPQPQHAPPFGVNSRQESPQPQHAPRSFHPSDDTWSKDRDCGSSFQWTNRQRKLDVGYGFDSTWDEHVPFQMGSRHSRSPSTSKDMDVEEAKAGMKLHTDRDRVIELELEAAQLRADLIEAQREAKAIKVDADLRKEWVEARKSREEISAQEAEISVLKYKVASLTPSKPVVTQPMMNQVDAPLGEEARKFLEIISSQEGKITALQEKLANVESEPVVPQTVLTQGIWRVEEEKSPEETSTDSQAEPLIEKEGEKVAEKQAGFRTKVEEMLWRRYGPQTDVRSALTAWRVGTDLAKSERQKALIESQKEELEKLAATARDLESERNQTKELADAAEQALNDFQKARLHHEAAEMLWRRFGPQTNVRSVLTEWRIGTDLAKSERQKATAADELSTAQRQNEHSEGLVEHHRGVAVDERTRAESLDQTVSKLRSELHSSSSIWEQETLSHQKAMESKLNEYETQLERKHAEMADMDNSARTIETEMTAAREDHKKYAGDLLIQHETELSFQRQQSQHFEVAHARARSELQDADQTIEAERIEAAELAERLGEHQAVLDHQQGELVAMRQSQLLKDGLVQEPPPKRGCCPRRRPAPKPEPLPLDPEDIHLDCITTKPEPELPPTSITMLPMGSSPSLRREVSQGSVGSFASGLNQSQLAMGRAMSKSSHL